MAANHKKIYRIRTGGQSGVDRAAMDFAREYGIPCADGARKMDGLKIIRIRREYFWIIRS